MLTARAEFRLLLRADNAETRLSGVAEAAGLIGPERRAHVRRRRDARAAVDQALAHELTSTEIAERGAAVGQDGARRTAAEWLRFPGVDLAHVAPDLPATPVVAEAVEDARYAPYVDRQRAEIAELQASDHVALPGDMRFDHIPGLSNEMVERLSAARPETLGAASRIRGITPAALTTILLHAQRRVA
jgi:tRNA uridine 5-carboxymethylaminomethyl modification enzyme